MPAKKTTKKKAVVKKTAKQAAPKKAPAKKPISKKTTTKKAAAKKAAAKKPISKKTVPKKTTPKKTAAKKPAKAPANKAVSAKTGPKKVKEVVVRKIAKKPAPKKAKKSTTKKSAAVEKPVDPKTKEIVLSARKRTSTPAVFKPRKTKNTPIVFTMEDVEEMLKTRTAESEEEAPVENKATKKAAKKKVAAKKVVVDDDVKIENRNHSAASLADILGFNPADKAGSRSQDKVPSKFSKYYKALLQLRDHVNEGLQMHSAETLQRSTKDDSGDVASYGQHQADAGTDTFNRDFALSLVSSEQEALYEIEEAIQRIFDGTYGVCEINGEPIAKDRLLAVPFTRYSLEGQRELEKQRRNKVQRVGVLSEGGDEALTFSDDGDDS